MNIIDVLYLTLRLRKPQRKIWDVTLRVNDFLNRKMCDVTVFRLHALLMWLQLSNCNLYLKMKVYASVSGAGEGRRPWATTISSSVPPHLTLPGKTTFLNDIFRAFKVLFSKIQPRHVKKHNSNHLFNST